MKNRSGLPEFWIIILALLLVLVGLLAFMPYGRLIVKDSFEFVLLAIRFVLFLLVLGVLYAGPLILGALNQIFGLDFFDQLNPNEDMGPWAHFFISLICAVLIFCIWGMIVPFTVNHNEWIKIFLRDWIGSNTHWEIFPWGWAVWAFCSFCFGQLLFKMLISD